MTYATTFSGIGGWEIGLNACGWDLKWQCESDEFCRLILKEHFNVPIYDDIRTILDHNPPPVDALIGSPPCQPFSVAGEGRGVADERHLYPSFIKLVGHIKPRWVLMENVPGLLSNHGAFGGYLAGLASLGYDIVWHCIPACAVGPNHQRDRLWIVAHAQRQGLPRREQNDSISGSTITPHTERSNRMVESWGALVNDGPALRELDGFSCAMVRNQVKAYGNAVIPQIPFIIGSAINEIEG